MEKKKVCILLPGENISPVGGYKIAYQYANALFRSGFDVTIVHSVFPSAGFPYRPAFWLRTGLRLVDILQRRFNLIHQKWFNLEKGIASLNIPSITKDNLPYADIYISTAISTAHAINSFISDKVPKYYFIQDFESWDVSRDYVLESYKWKMNKIVIAPWLQKIVSSVGEFSFLVPNGFDPNVFYLKNDIDERADNTLMYLASIYERKGTSDINEALEIVARKHEIKVYSFGACSRPKGTPSYVKFVKRPTLKQLVDMYNQTAIFIGGSREEGYGLPVGEAMFCGCAIVCTITGGYQAMVDDTCALQSSVKDPQALADNILKLIENGKLRRELAKKGNAKIQHYLASESERKFVDYIKDSSKLF